MTSTSYQPDAFADGSGELSRLGSRARMARRGFIQRLKALGLRKGMRAVDLGCGEGTLTLRLASYCNPGKVLGIDNSERCLELARKRSAPLKYDNVEFRKASVTALPIADAQFDFAHVRLVLQHLAHPRQALAEIRRILSPGGVLVVEDIDHGLMTLFPEPPGWTELLEALQQGQRKAGGDPQIGRQLPGLLRGAGFEAVKVSVTTAHGNGAGLGAFAELLLPSLVEFIDEPMLRESAEALVKTLADPRVAADLDLFLPGFCVSARKPKRTEPGA